MAQYNTFFIPHGDTGAQQEALNSFLRSHRVLKVEKSVFPEGWAFCVEWLDGAAAAASAPFGAYQREKVDYMKVLPPEVFSRFSELRKRRGRGLFDCGRRLSNAIESTAIDSSRIEGSRRRSIAIESRAIDCNRRQSK